MRNKLLLVILFVFSLTGCTNDQFEQAIEDCKNDSECYVIVDQLIEEEMNARGIQGGTMTSLEMDAVILLIEEYAGESGLPSMENYYGVIDILDTYTNKLYEYGYISEALVTELNQGYSNLGSQRYINYLYEHNHWHHRYAKENDKNV
mgnify:CR=1 FL=1